MTDRVESPRRQLLDAYRAAIDAVGGRSCVRRHLQRAPPAGVTHLVAVGKAAAEMTAGAFDALGPIESLVITKAGHGSELLRDYAQVRYVESAHPVPDARSLVAGAALLELFREAPSRAGFLCLLSGGASSLVEALPCADAQRLAELNRWLLGAGLDIHQMNRVRKRLSRIKAGRLAAAVAGRPVVNLMISDVPGNDPKVIGSGPLVQHEDADIDVRHLRLPTWLSDLVADPPPLCESDAFRSLSSAVVAAPEDARAAAAGALRERRSAVTVHEDLLQGDALDSGRAIARLVLDGPPGAQVWAGETTVVLPERPGRGGRCQSLALAAAVEIAGRERVWLLAAGTDGTDGPGEDAGALVDGGTVRRGEPEGFDALSSLAAADAGRFLDASGDLVHTGPTGTNVMDLVIALKA